MIEERRGNVTTPDEYEMSDSERAMRMSDEEWEEREEELKKFVDYE